MSWEEDFNRRVAAFPEDVRNAHLHSSDHRDEILASAQCGCFFCCNVFPPSAILFWADPDEQGERQTAICPRCGIDSVIGDQSGFPIDADFLGKMKAHWF
jgi:hypothetical protein